MIGRRPENMVGYHFYGCPAWTGGECICRQSVDRFLEGKGIPVLGATVRTEVVTTIVRKPSPLKPKKTSSRKAKVSRRKEQEKQTPLMRCAVVGGPGMLTKQYVREGLKIRWDVSHFEKTTTGRKGCYDVVVIMINNCSHALRQQAERGFDSEIVYQPVHGVTELVNLLTEYRARLDTPEGEKL